MEKYRFSMLVFMGSFMLSCSHTLVADDKSILEQDFISKESISYLHKSLSKEGSEKPAKYAEEFLRCLYDYQAGRGGNNKHFNPKEFPSHHSLLLYLDKNKAYETLFHCLSVQSTPTISSAIIVIDKRIAEFSEEQLLRYIPFTQKIYLKYMNTEAIKKQDYGLEDSGVMFAFRLRRIIDKMQDRLEYLVYNNNKERLDMARKLHLQMLTP